MLFRSVGGREERGETAQASEEKACLMKWVALAVIGFVLGMAVGQARLPMGDAPEWVETRAHEVWANLQRWRDAWPNRPA